MRSLYDAGLICMQVQFFKSPAEWRRWLLTNHATAPELWVGFYKKSSGRPSITWPESVDQALCFGWIDGLRKSIDEASYKIRFSARKSGSTWSAVNIKRVAALKKSRLMQPAGIKAFDARRENRSEIYSYEQRSVQLEDQYERELKRNKAAWTFFKAQPPWYRRAVNWWIVSAKKEETRLKRLHQLIADSSEGRTIPLLTRTKSKPPRKG